MTRLIILCLMLSLGGCAGTSILAGGTSLTASISNPVTPAMVYNVENGLILTVTGLNVYKKECAAGVIPPVNNIDCRTVVATMQGYVHQARPLIKNVRAFVRANDQINAIIAYNSIMQLVSDLKATALSHGVK